MIVPAGDLASTDEPAPAIPGKSLLDEIPLRSPRCWSIIPEVTATLWRTRRGLRRKGLQSEVDELRRRKPAGERHEELPSHVAAFRAARRLVPIAPNCLTDSLALAAFMATRGISADLVFGVKLDPFAAHCWLQNRHAILNDGADGVTDFTPIMVI
jgi:hypothetical protein